MGSSAQRIHGTAPFMGSRLKAQVQVLQQSTAGELHASNQILPISLAHGSILMFLLLLPHKCCVRPVLKLMHDVGRQHPRLRACRSRRCIVLEQLRTRRYLTSSPLLKQSVTGISRSAPNAAARMDSWLSLNNNAEEGKRPASGRSKRRGIRLAAV